MATHNEFGKKGEKLAEAYLVNKGYLIKERNYRFEKAEVDLIAEKDGILAVVEVKARSNGFLENLQETVNKKKIQLLVKAINEYVVENKLDIEVRFDIITVLKNGDHHAIEHFENAFYHF